MKRIVVYDDYLFGHRSLNFTVLKLLSKHYEIIVYNANGFYDDLHQIKNIHLINSKKRFPGFRRRYLNICSQLLNMLYFKQAIKEIHYDYILFLHFDINAIGMFIKKLGVECNCIYLFHHNTTDMIDNRFRKIMFNRFKNLATHLVLGEYIKTNIMNTFNVKNENIFVLNHPLSSDINRINKMNGDETLNIISTGWESDEDLIVNIIDEDRSGNFFKDKNVHIKIRSQLYEYTSNNLEVYKGTLSRENYMKLYSDADVVLLLYEKNYKNRFSGSAMDALQSGKFIVGTNIPVVREFAKLYPNNAIVINGLNELTSVVGSWNRTFDEKEYKNFIDNHSNERLEKQLILAFSKEDKIEYIK